MRGQSNNVAPVYEVQPLYRGTLNTYSSLEEAGLTVNNKGNAQALANTTLDDATPNGVLGGAVVRITGPATIGLADDANTGVQDGIVGIAIRNAAGEAFESTSSVASGVLTYIHGTGSLVKVPIYETYATNGTTALDYSSSAGKPVYASQNGLLTIEEGLNGGTAGAGATVIGVIVEPPTTSNPAMVVQLRV